MEGKVWGYMGLRMRGIWRYSRWLLEITGIATSGILFAQSSKSITCFGRAFHMKGALAVLAYNAFWGLVSVLEHAENLRPLFKGKDEFKEAEKYEQWCGRGLIRV